MAEYKAKAGYSAPLGAINSEIVALNASGVGVGDYSDRKDERTHGFIGREDGSSEKIDAPGSTNTDLHGIDDANDVAGTYDDVNGVHHGFARLKDGNYVELDTAIQGGAESSSVTAVSASGEVTGTYTQGNQEHVFIAKIGTSGFEDFETVDLKARDGTSITAATVYGVNNAGDIVGSYDKDGKQYGFVEHNGVTTTLSQGTAGQTVARGINNQGEVVGYYVDAADHHHGFTYTADGGYTTLDIDNSPFTEADAVNDAGQVTGTFAIVDDAGTRRFVGFVRTGDDVAVIDPGRSRSIDLVTINQSGLVGGDLDSGQPQAAVYGPAGGVSPPPAPPAAGGGGGGAPAPTPPTPAGPPTTTSPNAPTNNTAAPSVAFDPTIAVAPGDIVTLSGTYTAAANVSSIVVSEHGTVLGTATVNPNGSWSLGLDFTDRPGPHSGLTVTVTDVRGGQGTAPGPYNLTTDLTKGEAGGEPYRTVQDKLDPTTGAYTGSVYFNRNGSEYLTSQLTADVGGNATYTYAGGSFFDDKTYVSFADHYAADGTLTEHATTKADGVEVADVLAGGQTLDAGDPAATGGTRFVFSPRLGDETIVNFVTVGAGHDRIDLGHFGAGRLTQILDHAHDDGAGNTVLSIGHGNTITLAGLTPGDLTRRDFALHA